MGNKIEVSGIKFGSVRKAALHFGLEYKTIHARLKRGNPIEVAFSKTPLRRPGRSKPITVNGKTFVSIEAAAKTFGINAKTASARLGYGWSIEEAFGLKSPPPNKKKRNISVDGIEYPSIKAAAQAHGLKPYIVWQRVKRGTSIKEAFLQGKLPKKGKSTIVAGNKFESLKAAAKYYGVKYHTVLSRIRSGWSLKQALGLNPPPINTRPVSFRGRIYKSVAEISREFGIDPNLVRVRLANRRDIEEALGLKDFEYKTKPLSCVVRGRRFSSRDEAAKHFGVNKGNVAHRVNNLGWTLEQALELEPRPGYEKGVFGCVYLIEHKRSGKAYIGITRQLVETRFVQHVDRALSEKSHFKGSLGEAIHKQGRKNFEISILATGRSQAELQDLERQFIREEKTLKPTGYNLRAGGSGLDAPGRQITVEGKSFESVAAAARHFGIKPLTANERLRKGYSAEQAVGLKPLDWVHHKSRSLAVDGHEFKTIKETAEFFGQPIQRVRKRINILGWSIEDALKKPSFKRSKKQVVIYGKKYESVREASRDLGVPYRRLQYRLNEGFDPITGKKFSLNL